MVFRVVDTRRQNHFRVVHLVVRDDGQEMLDAIQPRPLLVDSFDDSGMFVRSNMASLALV